MLMKLRSERYFAAVTHHLRHSSMIHLKARCVIYPNSQQKRVHVPDTKVNWKVQFPEYDPPDFTDPVVKRGPVWADPDIDRKSSEPPNMKFNKKDGLVNRQSFTGEYAIENNVPKNPEGRTGLTGRGLLGKWGPNHAADPVVTRWCRDKNHKIVKDNVTNLPILQFVAILRKDSGEWAIPGGMVEAGETVSLTLKREFGEEAMNSLKYPEEEKKILEKEISKLFSAGKEIYSGYVDDPRNTDNAWMETVVVNFHDDDGKSVSKLPLEAGDDAGSVRWMTISSALELYASHSVFLEQIAEHRKAHW